ncbi:hypothetical protein CYMTET_33597, partial [Cymbomonas tetramitiformis]
ATTRRAGVMQSFNAATELVREYRDDFRLSHLVADVLLEEANRILEVSRKSEPDHAALMASLGTITVWVGRTTSDPQCVLDKTRGQNIIKKFLFLVYNIV